MVGVRGMYFRKPEVKKNYKVWRFEKVKPNTNFQIYRTLFARSNLRRLFEALERWSRSTGSRRQKISSRTSTGISFIIFRCPLFPFTFLSIRWTEALFPVSFLPTRRFFWSCVPDPLDVVCTDDWTDKATWALEMRRADLRVFIPEFGHLAAVQVCWRLRKYLCATYRRTKEGVIGPKTPFRKWE